MKRRTVLAGLTALSGTGGVTTLLASNDSSDKSPADTTMAQEQPARIRISSKLSNDVQASITVKSDSDEFLTAKIVSTSDKVQEVTVPIPTGKEYELVINVDAELDSPDEVTLGRETVQAGGSSLSPEDNHRFTHSDTTELHVIIGGKPFLEINHSIINISYGFL